jgi:aldose 1-epimerase
VIRIESDELRLEIDPSLGACVRGLRVRGPGGWSPLLREMPRDSRWFNDAGSYVLAPWCNRIDGGRVRWEGRDVALAPDWPDGSVIHGLVKDKAFEVEQRSPVSVVLRLDWPAGRGGWPWAFVCRVGYAVVAGRFEASVEVRRTDDGPGTMPAGIGFHPFFPRPLRDPVDRVTLKAGLRVSGACAAGIPPPPAGLERDLAAGAALTAAPLDHAFEGSLDGAELRWPASGIGVRVRCSASLGKAVIYTGGADTGPLPFFCVEPVSMAPRGIAMAEAGEPGTGVVGLKPGETLRGEWGLELLEPSRPLGE